MESILVDCDVVNIRHAERSVRVTCLPVDNASIYTWISAEVLKQIGVMAEKKDVPFLRASGETVTRQPSVTDAPFNANMGKTGSCPLGSAFAMNPDSKLPPLSRIAFSHARSSAAARSSS